MNFKQLTTDELQGMIIRGADLQTLYEIDLYIQSTISETFQELDREPDNRKKVEIKGRISWATNLHEICKKRQHDLREDNNAFNWRFRTEAIKLLSPELYNKIAENAKRTG